MVKSKFSFFKMVIKHMFLNTFQFTQSQFGVSPKGLNTINVRLVISKFITAMFDPKMFRIADIDQSMVPTPAVRMNDTIQVQPFPG